LGTPIGVVVIPEGFAPDGRVRIVSLMGVDRNGNQLSSNKILGGLIIEGNSSFWASSEYDSTIAHTLTTMSGRVEGFYKGMAFCYVRPFAIL
jgi:hypothetical protein